LGAGHARALAVICLLCGVEPGARRAIAADTTGGAATATGELKQWHRVTLTFEGPDTSETATPNPFRDYRLDVTFAHAASGETRLVPGFLAADGNAAETSATAGHRWRVHFSPNHPGGWRWRVSLRAGKDVAIADAADVGEAWAPVDGQSGSFVIGATDKQAPDFRARGHLEYVGERYLRFAGDGTYFLKAGVDSPETLLGYADFDGTCRDLSATNRPPAPNPLIPLPALPDGLHRYAPHLRDWPATKSFTSTGLGLLIADGAVSLETKAAELEPTLRELYPDVTLRHFTTMTSGYSAPGRSRWGENSDDWSATPFVPGSPLFAPGTQFAYWDEAQMMLGRVLTCAAKRDLLELLRERVFDPIGLRVAGLGRTRRQERITPRAYITTFVSSSPNGTW
jgi:hypothetical protein